MANREHLEVLKKGVTEWNRWRTKQHFGIEPDFSGANLGEAILNEANLSGAFLKGAILREADLSRANLSGAILNEANLIGAKLIGAKLHGADLHGASFNGAYLTHADLHGANLSGAFLGGAFLIGADLRGANLTRANLMAAHLSDAKLSKAQLIEACITRSDLLGADFSGADLSRADLMGANLTGGNLEGAILTGAKVYGISAWNVKVQNAVQTSLIITPPGEPEITVDNLEVAQFIYLLLHNSKIRDVIDTIGRKGVLLLGRFAGGRIKILERLRDELRKRDFVPIVFNFDRPETKDFTETIRVLAGLSHFVIAEITNPQSAPLELQATIPECMIPFFPIIEAGETPFAMLQDLWIKHRDWVFAPIHYSSLDGLVNALDAEIIQPAEVKFTELLARKAEKMKGRHV